MSLAIATVARTVIAGTRSSAAASSTPGAGLSPYDAIPNLTRSKRALGRSSAAAGSGRRVEKCRPRVLSRVDAE